MDGIEINIDNIGAYKDIALFRIRGYVDTTTSPKLQQTISQLLDKKQYQLIVDLSAVNYVSSAGWGVFVGEIRELQENGGDLKITQMTAEVFEVFEILEFNQILTYYDSLEEAIFDFDFCRGLNLALLPQRTIPDASYQLAVTQPNVMNGEPSIAPSATNVGKQQIADADLPLLEKVKKLVIENPMVGALSIKRRLDTPRYGNIKISYFEVRALLKTLGLHTKARRRRFFRSR